jgi:hypothetical protein
MSLSSRLTTIEAVEAVEMMEIIEMVKIVDIVDKVDIIDIVGLPWQKDRPSPTVRLNFLYLQLLYWWPNGFHRSDNSLCSSWLASKDVSYFVTVMVSSFHHSERYLCIMVVRQLGALSV